jgi:hypothetical protein
MIFNLFILPLISIFIEDAEVLPSIMLNSKEEKIIDHFLDSLKTTAPNEFEADINLDSKNQIQPLFLSAIIFFSKKNWTIWINDQAITTQQKSNFLKIHKVDYDHIVFSIPNFSKKKFFITPNQTFIPALEKVVNGDARENDPATKKTKDQQKVL